MQLNTTFNINKTEINVREINALQTIEEMNENETDTTDALVWFENNFYINNLFYEEKLEFVEQLKRALVAAGISESIASKFELNESGEQEEGFVNVIITRKLAEALAQFDEVE